MKILLVSATPFEIAPTLEYLSAYGQQKNFLEFTFQDLRIFPLITGIGAMKTAFAIARFNDTTKVDVSINIGVAGCFHKSWELGDVVEVVADRMADLGVEEADGSFTDVFDMELEKSEDYIHKNGWIKNDNPPIITDLAKVNAITVNKVHGTEKSIAQIIDKYKPDIETMEGAGFHYACKNLDVKHIQLRGLSNYVEKRNRSNWQLDKAIGGVNKSLVSLLKIIEPPQRKVGFGW